VMLKSFVGVVSFAAFCAVVGFVYWASPLVVTIYSNFMLFRG